MALLVLSTALYSRIPIVFGAPGIVKFLHFVFAIFCFALMIPFINNAFSKRISLCLFALSLTICLSAFINEAGLINIFLDFMLLSEPFILLILLINQQFSLLSIQRFLRLLSIFIFLHVGLAYIQFSIVDHPDDVRGLFLGQRAGAHVAGGVALTSAVYYFVTSHTPYMIKRLLPTVIISGVVVISDAKQVVVVFLGSLVVLLLTKINSLRRIRKYVVITAMAIGLSLAIYPVLSSSAQMGKLIDGLTVKIGIFPLTVTHYKSPLNWLFGLGPGHSVGRLAELIPDYIDQLKMLNATTSPMTQAAIYLRESHPLSRVEGKVGGSSIWSPFFFWAGIWGDLGIVGLGLYLYLWIFIYRHICIDDLSKFLFFNIILFGAVFGWLEEPGYTLFVVTLLGLNWQAKAFNLPAKN